VKKTVLGERERGIAVLHRQADTNSGDRGYFKLLQTIYSNGRRWRHSFRNRLQPVAGNHNRRVRHIHLYREGNLTDGIGPGKILTVFREGGKSPVPPQGEAISERL
jgi:hypothetical protein